jgi:hypothetical protein
MFNILRSVPFQVKIVLLGNNPNNNLSGILAAGWVNQNSVSSKRYNLVLDSNVQTPDRQIILNGRNLPEAGQLVENSAETYGEVFTHLREVLTTFNLDINFISITVDNQSRIYRINGKIENYTPL